MLNKREFVNEFVKAEKGLFRVACMLLITQFPLSKYSWSQILRFYCSFLKIAQNVKKSVYFSLSKLFFFFENSFFFRRFKRMNIEEKGIG